MCMFACVRVFVCARLRVCILLHVQYGGTALMRAAHQGHTQALRVILEESSAIDRAAFIDVKNKVIEGGGT